MSWSPYSGFRFLDLPSELVDRILCQLDLATLLRCKQVCKAINRQIENRKELQYIIELEIAGLERNENNKWPVAQRLEALRKYANGWNKLEWSDETVMEMLGGGLWELYGGVLAQSDKLGTFHFVRFPSVTRRIRQEKWSIRPDLGKCVRDFAMDPSQDLVAWITTPTREGPSLDIHLRSLKTNDKHPLAKNPLIQYGQYPAGGNWHFTIRIMREYIGVQAAHTPVDEPDDAGRIVTLLIWNWKKETLELALETNNTQSFLFLSERHVVLADLQVSDDVRVTNEPSLKIVDFKAEGNAKKTADEARHCLTLSYPTRTDFAVVISFGIFSDPSPGWTPSTNDDSPFFIAKENRVFVAPIRVAAQQEYSMLHFIPLSTLKKCLDRVDLSQGGAPKLSWAEWAPKDTRLLLTNMPPSSVWVCPSFGSRYTGREIVRTRGSGVAFAVSMYNFNQLSIRREKARGEIQTSSQCIYMDDPSVMGSGAPFVDEIQTFLPFTLRLKTMPIEAGVYFMMCSADNMILVNTTVKEYRIYTF